jgi:hypothetical protein
MSEESRIRGNKPYILFNMPFVDFRMSDVSMFTYCIVGFLRLSVLCPNIIAEFTARMLRAEYYASLFEINLVSNTKI